MHKLVEVYDQVNYSLRSYLELHKIVSAQGMGEQEIVNVLKLANNNEVSFLRLITSIWRSLEGQDSRR